MARPGYFFIDPHAVIREKFFEAKYRQRLSGSSVLAKLFPKLGQEVTNTFEAPHLQLLVEQSDHMAFPGSRITLIAEVRLLSGVHVYAPGAKGYKSINLLIDPMSEVQLKSADYPRSKIIYLEAIRERVSVFEGIFRIRQDLQVATAADFSNSLGAEGKTITIAGKLEYQACDRKICYRPTSVPVQWRLQVVPLDRQRAPEDIRHK
jgi:hypothetical protein